MPRDINITWNEKTLQNLISLALMVYVGLTLLMQYTRNIWLVMGNTVIAIFVIIVFLIVFSFIVGIYNRILTTNAPVIEEYYYENKLKGTILISSIFGICNITFILSSLWYMYSKFTMLDFAIDLLVSIFYLNM